MIIVPFWNMKTNQIPDPSPRKRSLRAEKDRDSSTVFSIRCSELEMAMLKRLIEHYEKDSWKNWTRGTVISKIINDAHHKLLLDEMQQSNKSK